VADSLDVRRSLRRPGSSLLFDPGVGLAEHLRHVQEVPWVIGMGLVPLPGIVFVRAGQRGVVPDSALLSLVLPESELEAAADAAADDVSGFVFLRHVWSFLLWAGRLNTNSTASSSCRVSTAAVMRTGRGSRPPDASAFQSFLPPPSSIERARRRGVAQRLHLIS